MTHLYHSHHFSFLLLLCLIFLQTVSFRLHRPLALRQTTITVATIVAAVGPYTVCHCKLVNAKVLTRMKVHWWQITGCQMSTEKDMTDWNNWEYIRWRTGDYVGTWLRCTKYTIVANKLFMQMKN